MSLRRYVGLMSHANALIHHFDPACRAARAFPELPVSRLLISLNDFDLPAAYEESSSTRTSLDAILGFGSAAFTVLMFALAILPDAVNTATIGLITVIGVNGALAALAASAEVSIALPLIIGGTLVGVSVTREAYKCRKLSTAAVMDADVVETISGKKARYAAELDHPVNVSAKLKPSGGGPVDELESPVISDSIVKPTSDNFVDMFDEPFSTVRSHLSHRVSRKNVVAVMNDVLDSVETTATLEAARTSAATKDDTIFHDIGQEASGRVRSDDTIAPTYSISSIYIPLRKRKYLAIEEDERQGNGSLRTDVKINLVSIPVRREAAAHPRGNLTICLEGLRLNVLRCF